MAIGASIPDLWHKMPYLVMEAPVAAMKLKNETEI